MSPPTLTVVIATNNSNQGYLREAIQSALSQDRIDLEIVVTDDSKNDSARLVVEEFNDSRCHYRQNPGVAGPATNHFSAFAEARAPYIAIRNHDDVWERGFASALLAGLEANPQAVLAFCDHWVIDSSSKILESDSEANTRLWGREGLAEGYHSQFQEMLAKQTIPMAMGAIFRKSALSPTLNLLDPGASYDLWLTYLLCLSGGSAYYVSKRLSRWRMHQENLTALSNASWAVGAARCWSMIAQDSRLNSIREIAIDKAALNWRAAANASLRRSDRRSAIDQAMASLHFRLDWHAAAIVPLCLLPKRALGLILP